MYVAKYFIFPLIFSIALPLYAQTVSDTTAETEWYYPPRPLSDSAYNALTCQQKFVYNINHPESYNQICTLIRQPGYERTINRYLPPFAKDFKWSGRQLRFFRDEKIMVMTFIKAAIEEEIALQKVTRESKKKVAMSYKHAILAMNGVEMIPFLLKTYDPGTDMDMLTLFMLLMIDNEYIPFITSPFYCGFYENGYSKKREGKYATAIEDEILRQVTAFSNEKKYRK